MQSKAQLFIMQMQDYLRLGRETRMNEPGRLLQSELALAYAARRGQRSAGPKKLQV